jgi:hypothetical protein
MGVSKPRFEPDQTRRRGLTSPGLLIFMVDRLRERPKPKPKQNVKCFILSDLHVLEVRGFEPLAFSLRTRRSTN